MLKLRQALLVEGAPGEKGGVQIWLMISSHPYSALVLQGHGTILLIQMRKLRSREVKHLAPDYITGK